MIESTISPFPQLKLAEKNEDTDVLLWEEKIKLAEEDARRAIERAERAEKKLAEVERKPQKRSNLMSRISYFENAGTDKKEEKIEEVIEDKEVEVAGKKFLWVSDNIFLLAVKIITKTGQVRVGLAHRGFRINFTLKEKVD